MLMMMTIMMTRKVTKNSPFIQQRITKTWQRRNIDAFLNMLQHTNYKTTKNMFSYQRYTYDVCITFSTLFFSEHLVVVRRAPKQNQKLMYTNV